LGFAGYPREGEAMAEPTTSTPGGRAAPEAAPAPQRPKPGDPVVERLAALRAIATNDPARAQEDTWEWIKELGARRDADALAKLFALGTPPRGLDGPTDGILVTTLTNPLVDMPVRLLTSTWMPWQGKTFDAAAGRGVNRMTASSRLPAKVLWPRYVMREQDGGHQVAFDFVTAIQPGAIEPAIDVLKIDYAPVAENPDLIIRQIRDELVTLVPDTHLGRILFALPRREYTNIGYFALRQPAG
jgi:hypothetical protein